MGAGWPSTSSGDAAVDADLTWAPERWVIVRVRNVGAGGEAGAQLAPFAGGYGVHLDLGPAVAGVSPGDEIEPVAGTGRSR